jgi:exopolysaccharide production protein ExoY
VFDALLIETASPPVPTPRSARRRVKRSGVSSSRKTVSGLNAAASSRFRSESVRTRLARPHLVSPPEKRIRPDQASDAPDGEDAVELRLDSTPAPEARVRRASVHDAAPRAWSFGALTKRVFDVTGAVMLGLVFCPLMVTIVLIMRREGGSVIYRHRRVGRDGKIFECLKFRTMVPNAEQALRDLLAGDPDLKAEWVRDHKLRDDPRVTRLGRFLRRTSLDELPQIWNVIRGEMSLVGPRPVVREELLRYGRNVGAYFAAKPGITGLWQVSGRNDTNYRRRVVLDTYYVRNQNFLLDLYILLKTTLVVLGRGGAY